MLVSLLLLGGLAWVLSFRDLRMFKWEQLEERGPSEVLLS